MLKIQLLIGFTGLIFAIAGGLCKDDFNRGLRQSDQEAFDAYAHFAKQMHHKRG